MPPCFQVYNVVMCGVLPIVSFFNLLLCVGPNDIHHHAIHHKVLEIIVLAIITVEIILRFLVWPSKLRFLLDPLNWVDVISTLLTWPGVFVKASAKVYITYSMFFASFRFFRVFRIWRGYNPCRALSLALAYSIKDFFLTAFVFFLLEVMFGFLIFAVEFTFDVSYGIVDVVHALYWATITMTTVGYGDLIPLSGLGQILAGLSAVTGLLMIAMPAAILTRNYRVAVKHLEAAQAHSRRDGQHQGVECTHGTDSCTRAPEAVVVQLTPQQ